MVRKCFVPYCTNTVDTTPKITLFRASNAQTLSKWEKAIQRKDRRMDIRDPVCEQHFVSDDVVHAWTSQGKDFCVEVKLKRPRLKKGAIPRIFPFRPKLLTSTVKLEPRLDAEPLRMDSTAVIDPLNIKTEVLDYPDTDINVGLEIKEEIFSSPLLMTMMTFEDLSDSLDQLELPSKAWGAHLLPSVQPRYIVLNELSVSDGTADAVVFSFKQVCINRQMEINYSVLGRAIAGDKLSRVGLVHSLADKSLEEIRELLGTFDKLPTCEGGPLSSEMSVFSTECAFQDPRKRWRHLNCALVMATKRPVCGKCAALRSVLRIHATRVESMSGEARRMKLNVLFAPGSTGDGVHIETA